VFPQAKRAAAAARDRPFAAGIWRWSPGSAARQKRRARTETFETSPTWVPATQMKIST